VPQERTDLRPLRRPTPRFEPAVKNTERPTPASTRRTYGVRMAMAMLVLGKDEDVTPGLHGQICDAVKADSRVHDFARPEYREHEVRSEIMYPDADGTDSAGLITGRDAFRVAYFSDPLVFEIRVSRDNQESFRGDLPPTDSYFVAWDGLTVTTLFVQPPAERISRAAGRIAITVLRDAARRIQRQIYVQACDPAATTCLRTPLCFS
jgi:hypothetical protein